MYPIMNCFLTSIEITIKFEIILIPVALNIFVLFTFLMFANWCFSFAPELVGYSAPRDLHRRAAYSICESWVLIHQDVYRDLFVCS